MHSNTRTHNQRSCNAVQHIELSLPLLTVSMAVDSTAEYNQEAPGGTINQQFEPLPDRNLVTTPVPIDAQSNCRGHIKQKMNHSENPATYMDVDIEKGKLEVPKAKCADETVGNLKTEDSLVGILQREIASQLGGKLMQLLMNNSLELPKLISRDRCMNEKSFDTSTNRLRKYKRSASFNSRRVVLLFSILSIMGTLVLIYLTLRVKQIAESGNV